jgi:hypothetical protein
MHVNSNNSSFSISKTHLPAAEAAAVTSSSSSSAAAAGAKQGLPADILSHIA